MPLPTVGSLAEFTYAVLLRPPPLRRLTNAAIRSALPKTVRVGPATVVLNPSDAVVSGALALSVYERRELSFVEAACDEGTVFVDVGANVGLYTALAAHYVGESGSVIALEPDPVSRRFLARTIAQNHPERVAVEACAATARAEPRTLYASTENRGDNRLSPHRDGNEEIAVDGRPLDEILGEVDIDGRHLFLKVDVQGSEADVVLGARESLQRAGRLTLLMEFWPSGLRLAGTDPRELLETLLRAGVALYELGDRAELTSVGELDALIDRYPGRRYTNIVALTASG